MTLEQIINIVELIETIATHAIDNMSVKDSMTTMKKMQDIRRLAQKVIYDKDS